MATKGCKDLDHRSKMELVEKLRGGVIMDVTTPEQARIAEDAGARLRLWPSRGCRQIFELRAV